jgi:hypothetical protein
MQRTVLNRSCLPRFRWAVALCALAIVAAIAPRTISAANLTYVDADPTAVVPNIEPLSAFSYETSAVNNNNLWGQRKFGAINPGLINTIYESGITEDSPELIQTISGLTAGKRYDVYLSFWVGDSTSTADWQIYGGFSSANGDLANHIRFNRSGPTVQAPNAVAATLAMDSTWDVPPLGLDGVTPIFHEGNRDMRLGLLGSAVASASGNVLVYINDSPGTGTAYRTWLDGVAYKASAIPGDFDSDGDVDGADFVAWQTNFPKATGAILAEGDADNDGDVDGADFVVWQTNFPFTPGPAVAPVPEPSAAVLAAIAAALGLFQRNARAALVSIRRGAV